MIILAFFLSCTIVKHEDMNKGSDEEVTFYFEDESFDAASYVKENWDSRILPEIRENASELEELIGMLKTDRDSTEKQYGIRKEETSPYSFMIKGQFKIKEINRTSSAGILYLDLADISGNGDCAVQIGPVIKKSMIRDSLEFIKFGDFSNQIEFANISRELNFHVRDNVLNGIDDTWQAGMTMELYGVFTMDDTGAVLITPVSVRLADGESNG
ncbi:MAG: DUF2291 domain-containing protein [Spirochaetales bacterium]|nr:DUF2291 domain-containing protein [Spirochaetales bacterium]